MLDDEELNMIATCERLDSRMTGPERSVIVRLKAKDSITRVEDAELRAVWDRVTNNGTDEG